MYVLAVLLYHRYCVCSFCFLGRKVLQAAGVSILICSVNTEIESIWQAKAQLAGHEELSHGHR